MLLAAGVAGVLLTFLPIYSVSSSFVGISSSDSVAAFDGWQGKVGLLGFLGSAFFGWFLCRSPRPNNIKNLLFAALGCAAVAGFMALWLFWDISRTSSMHTDLSELPGVAGKAFKVSAGMTFVGYLYAAAGVAALVGGGLRAKEEKLF